MGVLGIGGVFFRARDPEALTAWYRDHLNVGGGCSGDPATPAPDPYSWVAIGGQTVFSPFKADTDYWAADRQWMLNLRVSELDALVAALEAAGIPAERRAEWDSPEAGRFARITDPEGNPIELWEPPVD